MNQSIKYLVNVSLLNGKYHFFMLIDNNIHGKNNTFNRQNIELYNLSLYDTYIECGCKL